MTNITIVDAIMGTGKTSWAVDMMCSSEDVGFHEEPRSHLYIAPREEDYREVQGRCAKVNPDFRIDSPIQLKGRKMNDLLRMMAEGQSIASTHALFKRINQDMLDVLAEQNYTLIVDEETEWAHEYDIRRDDARGLFEAEFVKVDSRRRVQWNYEKWPAYDGNKYAAIKGLCDNGNLIHVDDTFLVWEMPIAFLEAFKHIYIMTYLFEGSVLSAYLKSNDTDYKVRTLDADRNLVDFDGGLARKRKAELRELITIIDNPKLNAIGTPKNKEQPLSGNWLDLGVRLKDGRLEVLQRAAYNFFNNYAKGKAGEAMWATLNRHRYALKGNGYSNGFTTVNLKATNKYRDRKNLAYLVNVFMRPRLVKYFEGCGIVPNEKLYAVSQLVQWVWRSRIRMTDGSPRDILLFLPSERMRTLFQLWLDDKFNPKLNLVPKSEREVLKAS